jgi:hypothetical protein
MNDKVTAVHTAPASAPAKEIPATSPVAQPVKVEEIKVVEPAVALATKS